MDCTGRCFVRPLQTPVVAWTVPVGVSLDLCTSGVAWTVPVGVSLGLTRHQLLHGLYRSVFC